MGIDPSVLDDLLGIAEITTVFIGFAVLISVIKAKATNQRSVMGMVLGASMLVIACILPLVLRTLDIDTALVLQLSSGTFIVINAVATIAMFRYIPGFAEGITENPMFSFLVWGLEAGMYLLLICCAFGVFSEYVVTIYYSAIALLLFQVILLFVGLTFGLMQNDETELLTDSEEQ